MQNVQKAKIRYETPGADEPAKEVHFSGFTRAKTFICRMKDLSENAHIVTCTGIPGRRIQYA